MKYKSKPVKIQNVTRLYTEVKPETLFRTNTSGLVMIYLPVCMTLRSELQNSKSDLHVNFHCSKRNTPPKAMVMYTW